MSEPNDGGPAFARAAFFSPEPQFDADHAKQDGMSLRDYFAAQALQGLWANSESAAGDYNLDAKACYEIADAMLRAREAKP